MLDNHNFQNVKVSKLAQNLIGSEIIKIGNQVNDLKAEGKKIANLTIGDLNSSIYPIPSELEKGIQKAYQNNLTNYPPANGLSILREAVSQDIKERYDLSYTPDDVLVAGGSRPLIYACYQSIVDPGDKVVYPTPSWNNNHYAYLTSAQSVEVQTSAENNFLPTAEDLKPHLKGAVLLALCSPLNPTGTMYTKEQLERICELVLQENKSRKEGEKPLYLMYDQIYAMLTFENEHFNPVSLNAEMKPYTVFIDGSSKCFAATGVRVGWGFGPSEVISKMKAFLSHIGAWAPKPEQHAVGEFLKDSEEVDRFVTKFKGEISESLSLLHSGIQRMKSEGFKVDSIVPMGALYLTIELDYIGYKTPEGVELKDTMDLVSYLIKEAGVALVPFSAFGNKSDFPWFRASVGGVSKQEVEELFEGLQKAISALVL